MRRVVTGFNLAVLFASYIVGVAHADGLPKREVIVQVEKTAFIWVVGAWNFETCRILTDTIDAVPQYADIATLCGVKTTSLINSGSANLYYLGEYKYLEDTPVPLPEIEIISSVENGSIVIWANDPIPEHSVKQIDATINGNPAVCDSYNGDPIASGLKCTFPINNPPLLFTAFAVSTYGDNSKIITLRIGNKTQSNLEFQDPEKMFAVIADSAYTQYNLYHDIPRVWGVVPGIVPLPEWLNTVQDKQLITDQYYYYLAGQILLESPLAGQNCPNRGISGQYATNCGVLSVFDDVYLYQNAYNQEITLASAKTGVPNMLIKRIVAVESQFYPNALGIAGERGLYQFTRDGADTLLRWNGPFYYDICALYWDYCGEFGYDVLEPWQRDVLMNHVLAEPNNLLYLGSALKANAFQVKRILENVLRIDDPGNIFSYEDLWKITVLNYHAGAIVTSAVLVNIRELELPYSWDSFATVLFDLQPSALKYVNRVYRGY